MRKISSDAVVKAISQYNSGDSKIKESLTIIFGGRFFMSITERIKSYEDAAEEIGIDPVASLPFQNPINDRQLVSNAGHKLDVIAEALLEGLLLVWAAGNNQRKWIPRFYDDGSGSGFRFDGSAWANAATGAIGGARLYLPTQELSDYFGSQFIDIWKIYLTPIK